MSTCMVNILTMPPTISTHFWSSPPKIEGLVTTRSAADSASAEETLAGMVETRSVKAHLARRLSSRSFAGPIRCPRIGKRILWARSHRDRVFALFTRTCACESWVSRTQTRPRSSSPVPRRLGFVVSGRRELRSIEQPSTNRDVIEHEGLTPSRPVPRTVSRSCAKRQYAASPAMLSHKRVAKAILRKLKAEGLPTN